MTTTTTAQNTALALATAVDITGPYDSLIPRDQFTPLVRAIASYLLEDGTTLQTNASTVGQLITAMDGLVILTRKQRIALRNAIVDAYRKYPRNYPRKNP